jgi:hypothetical protein
MTDDPIAAPAKVPAPTKVCPLKFQSGMNTECVGALCMWAVPLVDQQQKLVAHECAIAMLPAQIGQIGQIIVSLAQPQRPTQQIKGPSNLYPGNGRR